MSAPEKHEDLSIEALHLITAAPDLLAALDQIVGLREVWFTRAGGASQIALDAIRIARDAIDKARRS